MPSCALKNRWFSFWLALFMLVGATPPAWSAGPWPASVVTVPGGDRVQIGEQGVELLDAADSGRLEDVLHVLAQAGRAADGVAVLIYVAKNRPELADGLAALGLAVLAKPDSGVDATTLLDAIAQAAREGAEFDEQLKGENSVSGSGVASVDLAGLQPAAGPHGREGDSEPSVGAQLSPSVTYGAAGGFSGGAGTGLPAGLFIGSSSGVRTPTAGDANAGQTPSADPSPATPTAPPAQTPPVVAQQPDPGVVDPPADGGVS